MIYFNYTLKDIGNGELIGPATYLPDSAETGRVGADGKLYGKADIGNLSIIADFNPVEVTKAEYPWSLVEQYQNTIDAGYQTTFGYTLALTEKDRSQFVSMLVLLREAGAPDDMLVSIADDSGSIHQLTVQALRQTLVGYGLYYQGLWAQSKAS